MSNNTDRRQENQGRRKEKVCLIGDSIAGQINVPVLGKSTNTYVRRLKAPKINNVGSYTNEVKDAKLVIVHTGVNNLRDKEDMDSCVNSMVSVITTVKETAPAAKLVVSKITPVGDEDLSIDSTILNASCEKKLREIHKDIQFIDHANLADHGRPIKSLYKPDLLHLSYNGVTTFSNNLRQVIDNALTQKESINTCKKDNKTHEYEALRGRTHWDDRRRRDSKDGDRRRDYHYDNEDRYDRRRRYDKHRETHLGPDTYRGRTYSEGDYHHRDRDYYNDSRRRYEGRYDEYSDKDSRYFEHKGYSYRSEYDNDYYRY